MYKVVLTVYHYLVTLHSNIYCSRHRSLHILFYPYTLVPWTTPRHWRNSLTVNLSLIIFLICNFFIREVPITSPSPRSSVILLNFFTFQSYRHRFTQFSTFCHNPMFFSISRGRYLTSFNWACLWKSMSSIFTN